MDIQCLRVAEVVGSPHPVDELTTREHPARVAHEHLEELEFLQRHADLAAVDRDGVPVDVQRHAPSFEDAVVEVRLGGGEPAQHCAHPCEQFPSRIGLGHIVVSAELESHDDIDLGVLRREHDDRNRRRGAQLPTYLGAGHPGKHEIEQHDVGAELTERGEGGGSILGDLDLITLPAQQVRERVGEVGFVLDK